MSKVKVLLVSELVTRSPIELLWTAKNSRTEEETDTSQSPLERERSESQRGKS